MDILPLIQQQHGPQIPYPLVCELLWGNQLQALQLKNDMRGITKGKIQQDRTSDTLQHRLQTWRPEGFGGPFALPAQSVLGSPTCAYTTASPHFYNGKCCPLLWKMNGWQHTLSGSSLAPLPGSEPSGWSGSAPAVWSELASSATKAWYQPRSHLSSNIEHVNKDKWKISL